MNRITTAQQIKPYTAPQYLIEPIGREANQADVEAINNTDYEVIETTVAGWGPNDHIIRTEDGVTYLAGTGEAWCDPEGYIWTRDEWEGHADEEVKTQEYRDAVEAYPSAALSRDPDSEVTLEKMPS